MKTDMQSTSLEAYREIQPSLGEKQAVVYRLLCDATRKGFNMTNNEIANLLRWPICCVTGRVWELRNNYHVVVLSEKRSCHVTGFRAMAWKALFQGESQT